ELLDGVAETLRSLSGRFDLMLITKGDLFDQEGTFARSGVGVLSWGVDVLSEKNVESYQHVFKRRGVDPQKFVMVGNSLRSDILPVVTLGARAVHIPSDVTWEHEQVSDSDLPKNGWVRIASIIELPAALDTLR